MNSKLILCLALLLAALLFDRNSAAAVIFPKSPAGGAEMALQCANDCLQQTPSFFGNEPIDSIRITCAFQGYQCQLKDVMSGYLLSTATPNNPVIWSYVVVHATDAVALVQLMVDEKAKTGLKFAGMFGKGWAAPVLKALHTADQLPQVAKQNYEFRFLTVYPVFFAVWLHGKTNDIIIPLPSGPGKWKAYQPYAESEMIQLLQPEVEKRMGSDVSARNIPFSQAQTNSLHSFYVHFGVEGDRLLSTRVRLGEPIFVRAGDYWNLSGDIKLRGTNFLGDLMGGNGQQSQFYQGPMVLEKPCFAQGGAASGGAGSRFWFVLSTNSDSRPIVKWIQTELGVTNHPVNHPVGIRIHSSGISTNAPEQIAPNTGLPPGHMLIDPRTGLPLRPKHNKGP